jgi:predicted metal-dependent phosphoesterase TrpH
MKRKRKQRLFETKMEPITIGHDDGQCRRLAGSLNAVIRPRFNLSSDQVNLVDTHVHTVFSDGVATVSGVEETCLKQHIGCFITDHNEIRGAIRLLERRRIPTLPAMELGSKERIELLVYFRDPQSCEEYYKKQVEPFRSHRWYAFLPRSLNYLLAGIFEHEALISMPHPFAPLWKNIEYGKKRRPVIDRALDAVDCIEVMNGGMTRRANRRALKLCEALDRIPLGGSDSHDPETIGSVVVAFNEPITSANLFDQITGDQIYGVWGKNSRPK